MGGKSEHRIVGLDPDLAVRTAVLEASRAQPDLALAPLVRREIHYRLLTGEVGVRQILSLCRGRVVHRVVQMLLQQPASRGNLSRFFSAPGRGPLSKWRTRKCD